MEYYWDKLKTCAKVAEERGEQYGDVIKNFKNISDIHKSTFGQEITPEQVIQVMIATKMARQKNKHKEDNIIDVINYWAILLYMKEL